MVAYNFMKKFADDVESGRKDFTIRDERKRHAKPGEPVQLYTGMRTKVCRKLVDPDPICIGIYRIELFNFDNAQNFTVNDIKLSRQQSNLIILLDGFRTREEFFKYHIGGDEHAIKYLIRWSFFNE